MKEICTLCSLSSTETKGGDLRSVFSLQFVRKSNLEGYYFCLLVWLLPHIIIVSLLNAVWSVSS